MFLNEQCSGVHRKPAATRSLRAILTKTVSMHYLRCVVLLLGVTICQNASAQNEEKAIKAVINHFFEAMEKKDTAMLRSTCMPMPILQSYMNNRAGKLEIITEDFAEFVAFVGSPSNDRFEEKLEFEALHTERSMTSVWTPYKFYLNGKLLHCGTNSFQLIKNAAGLENPVNSGYPAQGLFLKWGLQFTTNSTAFARYSGF